MQAGRLGTLRQYNNLLTKAHLTRETPPFPPPPGSAPVRPQPLVEVRILVKESVRYRATAGYRGLSAERHHVGITTTVRIRGLNVQPVIAA
jgi:hypothetical protein